MVKARLSDLVEQFSSQRIGRRRFIQHATTLGLSASAIGALLQTHPTEASLRQTTSDGTLNVWWTSIPPPVFSPLWAGAGSYEAMTRLICGSLLKMSGSLEPTPDLAERWDISPDATTFTFHLHQDITWSDGQPLTVEDAIFTFERAIDQRAGSFLAGELLGILGAEEYAAQAGDTVAGLIALDPYTLQIVLPEPNSAFISHLAGKAGFGLLPKHILGEVPPDQLQGHSFSHEPTVGAGAYTFARYETGQYVELVRNDNYFRGAPQLDRILLMIRSEEVALAQMETGELDFALVPVGETDRITSNSNLNFHSVVSPSITQVAINTSRPYLSDRRVRQAFMYAIDRQGFVDAILGGQAEIVNSPIIGPEWMGQPEFNEYPYDPDQAKSLLDEARWDPNQRIEALLYPSYSEDSDAFNAILQQQLGEVGVSVDLRTSEDAEIGRRLKAHDYDLYPYGGGVYRSDPNVARRYYFSEIAGAPNLVHYANDRVDELFAAGVSTPDLAKRKEAYTEVARILNEDVPTIFLWSPNSLYATSTRFQGFEPPSYTGNVLWNAEGWSIG